MNKLSSKHFMLLILSVSMIAIRSYSSIFIELGGRDTWILAIIACITTGLLILFLLKICVSTNTYDLKLIFERSMPKFLSKIFLFIFSIGLFLIAIESTVTNVSSIHTNYFISTPIWYCLIFFLVPAAYIICRNFNTILTAIIITVSLILLGDLIYLALILKYLDLNYLLPVLHNAMTPNKWLCLLSLIGSLSSTMIILPFLKYLKIDNKLLSCSTIAFIVVCFFIVTSFVSQICFLGPERASNIFFPEYLLSQRAQIANFFEYGEIFYLFKSSLLWLIKYIICSYGIIELFNVLTKHKKTYVILFTMVIFILTNYLTQNHYYLFYLLGILQYMILIPFILIPLLCFSIYKLKTK
jgi:spore germination protein (amino acid permease)